MDYENEKDSDLEELQRKILDGVEKLNNNTTILINYIEYLEARIKLLEDKANKGD